MLQRKSRAPRALQWFTTVMLVVALALAGAIRASAQGAPSPAEQLANWRIEVEELAFKLRTEQITATEYQQGVSKINQETFDLRRVLARLPRDQQTQINSEQETLFQVRIVPLREQWRQKTLEHQREAQARDAARQAELTADAERAGALQAARTLLAERLQRGEIAQAEFTRNDQAAEQAILDLQHKYNGYGPLWAGQFSRTVGAVAQRVVAEARQRLRLQDITSEVGKDSHDAAELILSQRRNQTFRQKQALTAQEEQAQAAALQAQLTPIQGKYASASPASADFRDRVARLVQAGTEARRVQWDSEATSALEAKNARRVGATATPRTPTAVGREVPAPTAAPPGSPRANSNLPAAPRRTNTLPSAPATTRALPAAPRTRNLPPAPDPRGAGSPRNIPSVVRQQRQDSSIPTVLVLLLLGGAGAAAVVLVRRRATVVVPRYEDLSPARPSASPIGTANAGPERSSRASIPRPPQPAAAGAAPKGRKEQLFAEQREKYQARYNDAVDEMTNASIELGQMTGVAQGIQSNLKPLSKTLKERLQALVKEKYLNAGKLLMHSALGLPVYRFFRKAGPLLKIAIVIGAVMIVTQALNSILRGNAFNVVVLYLLVVGVFFLLERHVTLTRPIKELQNASDNIKALSLAYIYADQAPHVEGSATVYHAISIAADGKAAPQEIRVPTIAGDGTAHNPETFLLSVGSLATYRIDQAGNTAPAAVSTTHEFMRANGQLLHQAVSEQKAFAANTLAALANYGSVAWRKRNATARVPHLEQLVQSVDRMDLIWRDTAVGDAVADFVLRRIDLFNVRDSATPAGLLLYGYAGNGKTHLARKLAESVSARLEEVDAATFNSAQAVKTLWEKSRGKPVVLLVESAERVFPRPGSENEGAGTREATLAWVTEWGKLAPAQSMVWVVMTVQNEKDLHPAVLSQFGSSRIEVTAPDTAARQLVLRTACRENQVPLELPTWLVGATGGTTIRDLHEIVKEVKLQSTPYVPTDAQWREAVKNVRGSDAEFKDERKTWDRLVLPTDIKDQLLRACRILRDAEQYQAKGVNVPNILLFGPPGTGKTDIARTFANEGGVKFVMASTADMKAGYIGQSAHLVRDVFAKARAAAPAVLFIDEIETVAAKRGSNLSDSFTQEIVTEMLAQMDGARKNVRPVFVLGATNLPEEIDPAILSRFTSKIEIPLPDESARREMLKRLLLERSIDPTLDIDEISALLAKRLVRKSGRDLVMLLNRAMERAVLVADSPDDIRLTRELLLAEVAPQSREVSEADLTKVWSQIVLKAEVKDSLLSKIRLFNTGDKAAPRGLLLYGPPGTGKTEIARRIADSTSSYFMPLTGSDLKSGYVGQSGQFVRGIWEKARSRGKCVIFVDECEGVFARRGGVNTDSASEELVREFLAMWDGVGSDGQVWVVGATNRRDQLDEAMVSRFGAAVEIGLPEAPERIAILRLEMSKLERDPEIPAFVGPATAGFAGRDLATVARDVCSLAAERQATIQPDTWREVIKRYAKASSESVDEGARWDTLVVSESTMETLKTVCESLRHIETLRKQGIAPPRGALLYGPPGTGKTQIARTIANESGLPFLAASTADIKAGFIGQSGQNVRELFERARGKAPCVLFIDEIESVVPSRGGRGGDQFTGEIVTQMLQELDGVKKSERHVFVLAATNHPDQVDSAILSRFPERIEIPNPGPEERRRLFRIALGKQPRGNFDVDELADELSRIAGNVSGRDIQSLVVRASQLAVQRALKAGTPDQVVLTRDDVLARFAPRVKEPSEADVQKGSSQIVL